MLPADLVPRQRRRRGHQGNAKEHGRVDQRLQTDGPREQASAHFAERRNGGPRAGAKPGRGKFGHH